MASRKTRTASRTNTLRWNSNPIAGVDQVDKLSASFQYFAAYWHVHKGEGRLPDLRVLERQDAPPVTPSGIVFSVEDAGAVDPDFRVLKASDLFSFYYQRKISGCRLDELFNQRIADRRRKRYARILRGAMPDYSKRRSSILGREIVWIERIYAPFAAENGEPAFLAGLVNLTYA